LADSPKARNYKELQIWRKGMDLARSVYVLTERLPTTERYGLTSQMRRSAVSVPSNIAEGQARRGSREFLHFLSNANGSLAELDTQLLLSVELGFLKGDEITPVTEEILEVQKMIAAIRRKLSGTGL
jgi:four helix bundle protein